MKRTIETNYYALRQSNSGGYWRMSPPLGHVVLVEAMDERHARERASDLGVEFGDTNDDSGDRWPDMSSRYSSPTDNHAQWMSGEESAWIADFVVSVCRLDGTVDRHERLAGHQWSERGEAKAEIDARRQHLEPLPPMSLSHDCEYGGSGRATVAVRDSRDGRTFLLSTYYAKKLGFRVD